MMNTGIYTITSPSGGQYVGSALHLRNRKAMHFHTLREKKHVNRILQNAFNKYDGELLFETLLICEKRDLLLYEQRAMDVLKPRYNIVPRAGSSAGYKFTPERLVRHKIAVKAGWEDPKKRRRQKRVVTEAYKRPEVKARHRAAITDPVFKDKHRKATAAGMAKEGVRERIRAAIDITWSDPKLRKRHAATIKKAFENPELKERHRAATKAAMHEPGLRAKLLAHAVTRRRENLTEEQRARMRAGAAKAHATKRRNRLKRNRNPIGG